MVDAKDWLYDEFKQVGKDYESNDEVAIYDESHARFRDVIKESNDLLDNFSVNSGESLIDFGCGTGVLAIQAALRGVNVIAIDISPAMLAYATSKAKEASVSSIDFIHSGFLNYEHSAGGVDYIVTSFSFHHLPDYWKGIALKRMNAMLNSNGHLYIQDVVISEENSVENINSFIESQEKLGGEFLREDAIEHFKDEYSTYDWVLEGMLNRAGFAVDSKESFIGLISRYICSKK
ncbi:MAG: class I SAM-dependent methyltransferase [Gammaproteobacteria bacterium]